MLNNSRIVSPFAKAHQVCITWDLIFARDWYAPSHHCFLDENHRTRAPQTQLMHNITCFLGFYQRQKERKEHSLPPLFLDDPVDKFPKWCHIATILLSPRQPQPESVFCWETDQINPFGISLAWGNQQLSMHSLLLNPTWWWLHRIRDLVDCKHENFQYFCVCVNCFFISSSGGADSNVPTGTPWEIRYCVARQILQSLSIASLTLHPRMRHGTRILDVVHTAVLWSQWW